MARRRCEGHCPYSVYALSQTEALVGNVCQFLVLVLFVLPEPRLARVGTLEPIIRCLRQ